MGGARNSTTAGATAMMAFLKILFNDMYAALILFTAGAAVTSIFAKSVVARIVVGWAAVLVALCVSISSRSLFAWGVSAVDRPSVPAFVLLVALAHFTVRGWRLAPSAEFRFATFL